MRSTYSAAVVVMVMILLATPSLMAAGNPPPDRWEKLAVTKPDSPITVYLKDGTKKKGYRFQSFDNSTDEKILICTDRDKNSIQIKLGEIDKVDLYKRTKYMKWGLLYGCLGGIAVGGVMDLQSPSSEMRGMCTIYGAVVGAVSGYLVGGLTGNGETVYITKAAALAQAERRTRYPRF